MQTPQKAPLTHWAVVLAGGAGTRLAGLTAHGDEVIPKQYCALEGEVTLLRLALTRAQRLVGAERVVTVVAAEHEAWWQEELADQPPENVRVQPANKGTAAGLLFPLWEVARRDPGATVVVLPSDHYVVHEWTLLTAFHRLLAAVAAEPDAVVLLGMEPEAPVGDYGWIVPSAPARQGPVPVERFREKPGVAEAARLQAQGSLWNSFLFATPVSTLLGLYHRHLPEVLEPFSRHLSAGHSRESLNALYRLLPVRDFSRDLLERAPESLRVLAAPRCGWTDLGTPERVAEALATRPRRGRARPRAARASRLPFELAKAVDLAG
jgi:mannose-1-phosphate guanylyltransferase